MNAQCVSIRSREHPGERCPCRAQPGTEWCGKHKTAQRRFAPAAAEESIQHETDGRRDSLSSAEFATRLIRVWRRWLACRAGPLLWARDEANNPFDFFSGDPVAAIPLRDVVSYVDAQGKGYVMDIHSAISLLDHATANQETPLNPFNRTELPALFLRRVARHRGATPHETVQPLTEEQRFGLAVTDLFRAIEDLGYYTDPAWFFALDRIALQRLYLELADIWTHRASLSRRDRERIVPPPAYPFPYTMNAALIMQLRALRPLLLETCRLLVTAAVSRADRQTGVMYVLGALSIVSAGAATAYPWLREMFAPGRVTHVAAGQLIVLHPGVMMV